MTSLLILGAGGHARVLAETALAQGGFSEIAFLDDDYQQADPKVLGWPVLGPLHRASEPLMLQSFQAALVGIGNAAKRLHWLDQLSTIGYERPRLIHPTACVSASASLGPGSVVLAQAAVQALAHLGTGVILNTACSIDHDVHLGDGVHICPGARIAGDVHVGARSWIGIGACVTQQVMIGVDVMVGAGAAVVQDLEDGVTAVGVPAQIR